MRVKPLPAPPDDLDAVRTAHGAVPLVPGNEGECCARLADRLDLPARDEARTWLTFLRGLGLVRRVERGFVRIRRDPDRDDLARSFREGVFGARESLALLGEDPRPADAVYEGFEPRVPGWERAKHPGTWREIWRDRTADLLDWLVLLGLARRADGGYVRR